MLTSIDAFILYGSCPLAISVCRPLPKVFSALLAFLLLNLFFTLFCLSFMSNIFLMEQFVCDDALVLFVACFAFLSYAAFVIKKSTAEILQLMGLIFLAQLFLLIINFYLYHMLNWHAVSYDPLLYRIDASLGFSASYWFFNVFSHQHLLFYFIYQSLPLSFFVICADYFARTQKLPMHFIIEYLLVAAFGCLLYNLIPATGPLYVNGSADLTGATTMLLTHNIHPLNAMPSLHVAWIYLTWRASAKASPWFYLLMTLWSVAIIVSIFVTGEHYLIDALLGIIFAVSVRAVCQKRYFNFIASALIYLFWMMIIFLGVKFLTDHLWLNRLFWLGTLGIVLCLDFKQALRACLKFFYVGVKR